MILIWDSNKYYIPGFMSPDAKNLDVGEARKQHQDHKQSPFYVMPPLGYGPENPAKPLVGPGFSP
jgi:hypothetical protein